MRLKEKLTFEELMSHMKEKGIRFEIVSEKEAEAFLHDHNYYMKLASYRMNYLKCPPESKRAGEYQCLDFAYLKELSTIDMHLRYLIMQMCLDIEHALKVQLLTNVTENENEDGYKIVKSFLTDEDKEMGILKSIRAHKSGEYCSDLIDSYYPYFPVWVLVELISFSSLVHVISFYDKTYQSSILIDSKYINIVRDFRNACAHSNCLINQLAKELPGEPDSRITTFVSGMKGISKAVRVKYLHRSFTYNFTTLLFVYDYYVPESAKKKRYQELQGFLNGRVVTYKEYFKTNAMLCGTYNFVKKLIDNLCI